ncbi:acetate kinase [Ralstonia sp. A12]|uniref:acetate/propionate family kinase n=1 Tax=Ralstonia sp. A12 TaxID=1217052 RepID=UPI000575C88C|nr:acetate/propionate family kinase [Ralstonia sp. A12]KHK58264.1 acetate kinase [Ralstonia sp. A12]
MNDCIVVLNCGSSSIKFALFDATLRPLPRTPVWNGKVEGIGTDHPVATETGLPTQAVELDAAQPYHAALLHIRQRVEQMLDGRRLTAVAHRVVHGGSKYFAPVRVDAGVLADLRSYIPLAPLHQPFALEAIEALLSALPDVPQVACFDTAFHHTLPQVEMMLPLPYAAWERGLRRYGFHGLSYEYMSIALAERHGEAARGRTIVAHLGSGASLCAMQGLTSVATTMGFSALDGLMMGTRCGALDPGAVLYLMETEHLSPAQVGHVLYHESGLLGVSGLSSDPRDLLPHEADNPRVQAALALYVRRIVREIGALVAVLGGLDLLVFTAGIGEHNAALRERVVHALSYLGADLDDVANQAHAAIISRATSRIRIAVEPTNEEWVAAQHAVQSLY